MMPPNGAGTALLDALARAEPLALALLAEAGIMPSGDNNLLARVAASAPVHMPTIQAGGGRAIEAAARWAERSYYVGLALGLRLRGVE